MWRKIALIVVLLSLEGSAVQAAETHYGSQAGYGLLAIASNAFYMPAKLLYATVGGLTGGLAYLCTVGDVDTARNIWSPSLGGTYVITPAMLRNEEPILFSGVSYSRDSGARGARGGSNE